jgi:class 3 adenylate cyclase
MRIGGTWPSLVERFIEFSDWPTSRKSALLYGLALLFHTTESIAAHFAMAHLPWIDINLVDRVYWTWNAQIAISFLISLAAALRGVEGYWTLWLNVVPYGLMMMWAITIFGIASTAFAVWFPAVIVLVTVWYSPRDGFFAFLYGLFLIVLYCTLVFTGVVPFAPALLDRAIDAQNSALWTTQVFSNVLFYFSVCFGLVMLLISALHLQRRRLSEAQRSLDRSNRLIARYVPSQLADKITRGDPLESFRPERVKVTVFFSDVEGFSDASDRLDPEDLAGLLNEYLSEMMEVAESFGATVNHIVGDGIMIVFGAPQATSDRDHALRAVGMALAMQQRMGELQHIWAERGIDRPFRVRIGINTGYASVGDFGSPGRKLYSAIGMQANLAARIQAHADPGKVLLSQFTWALVREDFPCLDRGEIKFKGLQYAVRVYEVAAENAVAPTPHLRLASSREG